MYAVDAFTLESFINKYLKHYLASAIPAIQMSDVKALGV